MASSAAESDEMAAEIARLEAALERIAERSEMAMTRAAAITSGQGGADSQAAARRLDSLIGRLREAVAAK